MQKLEDYLKTIKPRKPRKNGKVDIIVNTSKIGNTVKITASQDIGYHKWFKNAGGGDLGVILSETTNKMIGAIIELPKNWSGKVKVVK
ncbi:MAG: hypothetical protein AABY22_26120 [Nanoarchaeota archaeon]